VDPCHHGMARPPVTGGGDSIQVWSVTATVLNKQSTRGGSPAYRVWWDVNNSQ